MAPLTSKTDFSTFSSLFAKKAEDGPKRWLRYNDAIYPPQAPDEERRPAVSYNNMILTIKPFYLITFVL